MGRFALHRFYGERVCWGPAMMKVDYDCMHRIGFVFGVGCVCALASLGATTAYAQTPPVVTIVALTCMKLPRAGEIEVQGEVQNVSSQPIKLLILSAVFDGPAGQFVSTSDLPVEFDPVMPGQVSPFDGYGDYNPIVRTVKVTPALEGGPSLPFSGDRETQCQESKG